jgi:hypothetical protein
LVRAVQGQVTVLAQVEALLHLVQLLRLLAAVVVVGRLIQQTQGRVVQAAAGLAAAQIMDLELELLAKEITEAPMPPV